MSDAALSEAERRWRATGSTEDEGRLLALRVRSGRLAPLGLEIAAALEHPAACWAAREVAEPPGVVEPPGASPPERASPPVGASSAPPTRGWWRRLGEAVFGPSAVTTPTPAPTPAVAPPARPDVFARLRPFGPEAVARALVAAARALGGDRDLVLADALVRCPCEYHRRRTTRVNGYRTLFRDRDRAPWGQELAVLALLPAVYEPSEWRAPPPELIGRHPLLQPDPFSAAAAWWTLAQSSGAPPAELLDVVRAEVVPWALELDDPVAARVRAVVERVIADMDHDQHDRVWPLVEHLGPLAAPARGALERAAAEGWEQARRALALLGPQAQA